MVGKLVENYKIETLYFLKYYQACLPYPELRLRKFIKKLTHFGEFSNATWAAWRELMMLESVITKVSAKSILKFGKTVWRVGISVALVFIILGTCFIKSSRKVYEHSVTCSITK